MPLELLQVKGVEMVEQEVKLVSNAVSTASGTLCYIGK